MADVEIMPDWAARYVQENLAEHMHVINVLPIDKGALSGAYLMNTSKGAVVVQKSRIGEAQHWFMPLPGEHVSFACHDCQERMELVDPDVPRMIYCANCGKQHFLVVQDGELAVVDQDATPATRGFVHDGYTLYQRKSGYFFAKTKPKTGKAVATMPDGYEVQANPRTGVPELVERTCVATTAKGTRCRSAPVTGSDRCARHQG